MPGRIDISPLSITDGKISKGAKIDPTKLAPATSGQVLIAGTDGKFRPGNLVTTSSGDTVAQGPAGATGATGSQGATGATGATGAAGVDGTDATVTATTVNAAGAIMHTDVPDSDTGFVKRTGAETYDVDTATYSTTGHNHAGTDITSGTIDTDRLDVGASSGKVAAGDHTHASYITGNQSITLSGDVTGSGTTAITCVVGNDSHTHSTSTLTGLGGAAEKDVGTGSGDVAQGNHTHDGRYYQESEFLNTSAGAGDAGKPVKLDSDGYIDTSMINDGGISFVDLDDLPSTFTPSSHTHAASEITGWKTFYLKWDDASGSAPAGKVSYTTGVTDRTVILTHDLGTAYLIISMLDIDNQHSNGANRYVDMNFSEDVSVEYYTTNAVRLHFGFEVDADSKFKVSILGGPGESPP